MEKIKIDKLESEWENGTHTIQSGIKTVPIKNIVVNKDFMMRDSLDKKTIEEYKENLEAIIEANPIVVFETPIGLLLVDGFHRLAAARQLNWDKINVESYKGGTKDAYEYACLANLKHGKKLTPPERKRAVCEVIKLNVNLSNVQIAKLTAVSEPTIRRFRQELETNGEIKPQETRVGIDNKVYSVPASSTDEADPFDIWFEEHVIKGDTFDVLPNDSLKYDLIIVDPPYGITTEEWDLKNEVELKAYTRKWLNLILNKMKPSGRLFVFWSREYLFDLKELIDDIKAEYPLNFGGLIVWNFRNTLTVPNNRKEFKITWEPIFYFYGLDAPDLNRPDTELTGKKWEAIDSDVWTFAIPQSNFSDKKIHPAQKPLDLYKHIIQLSTKTNDLILDPFAGSGTTGHAAYELGREFKLIEQNSEYVDLIRQRLKAVFHNGK